MDNILTIIADDANIIPYRKSLNEITGGVTSTILLQQILYWYKFKGAFFKFKEPCNHALYEKGDSWCEELGFSRKEFDTALKRLKTKYLVDTKINANRVTYYYINESKLSEEIAKVTKSLYVKPKSVFTKSNKVALPITETTTEKLKINKKSEFDLEKIFNDYKNCKFKKGNAGGFTEFKKKFNTLNITNKKLFIESLPFYKKYLALNDYQSLKGSVPYINQFHWEKYTKDTIQDITSDNNFQSQHEQSKTFKQKQKEINNQLPKEEGLMLEDLFDNTNVTKNLKGVSNG